MALNPRTCRILAIDGGGIRGVVPATILAQLEKDLGAPLAQHFHLLAGTSTGGILACGLAAEVPTSKLVDFYFKDGPGIFNASFYSTIEGPKYQPDVLEGALKEAFVDTQLSDLKHDLICPAYDIEARQSLLFKSWKARGIEEQAPNSADFLLRQVARATSAAPTYFAPTQATAADGKTYALIDGGMYGNNPALIGTVAARRLMPLATRFLVVSIGTGENLTPLKYADAKSWGLVGWGAHLIDIIFDSMGSIVEYELDQIDIVSQVRLQSSLTGANDAMDDASPQNMKNLAECAKRTMTTRASDMKALVDELKTPLADRVALGYPTATGTIRPAKIKDFASAGIKVATPAPTPIAAAVGTVQAVAIPWRAAAALALAGAATFGPPGALVGAVLGYVGGRLVNGGNTMTKV